MDLRAAILEEHSKENSLRIAHWVGESPERIQALVDLFLNDEYRVVQRASWILSIVFERHPKLIASHIEAMVAKMQQPKVPVAVKRNVIRVLQLVEIPEQVHGPVMQICFDCLADPKETVAVRCFSMSVLAKLAKVYPDIRQELRLLIEDELSREPTAGFRARAKKVLSDKALVDSVRG